MDTVQDFEDILHMLEKHAVRYVIIGGLAFIEYLPDSTIRNLIERFQTVAGRKTDQ
jgi:hypothetical protein